MKLIFFGSDDFAAAFLKELIRNSFEIVACVTQPDKPKDRGMKVVSSPIKKTGLQYKIPVIQPVSVKDKSFIDELKYLQADLFIVIAYGKILPSEILQIPKVGALNVHGSLLPQYRGAAPINWAVINGEKETGLTIIEMNSKMDAGKMVAQWNLPIKDDDTSMILRKEMMDKGPQFLISTLKKLDQLLPKAAVQDETKVTIASKLTKELGVIHWNDSSEKIVRMVRGLLPWPTAYTYFDGKILKILEAQTCSSDKKAEAGEIIVADKKRLVVQTGQGALDIKMVHLESSKAMDVESFLRGHNIREGVKFGK